MPDGECGLNICHTEIAADSPPDSHTRGLQKLLCVTQAACTGTVTFVFSAVTQLPLGFGDNQFHEETLRSFITFVLIKHG